MSRRKGRYERRKTRREENRLRRAAAVGGLHDVFGYDDMYKAGKKCCNGVRWKNSTQRFEMHLFSGTARRRRLLLEQKWIPGAYVHFTISERGKTRPIDAGGVFVGHDTQLDSPFVTARLPHAGLIGLPGNPLAVMMIVQCVLLESVRSVFHLPEAPAQTVEAVMTEDIEAGICGELCVNVNESAAKPLIKGTGRMRVFDSARGFVRLNGQGIKRGERVRVELFRN